MKSWQLKPLRERIEIRVLQYKVQRARAYTPITPTVSTVFHSKPRYKNFMQTWLHWTRQHPQLVQKDFLALFRSTHINGVCIVVATSMIQNYTPLPTMWSLSHIPPQVIKPWIHTQVKPLDWRLYKTYIGHYSWTTSSCYLHNSIKTPVIHTQNYNKFGEL